MSCLTRVTFVTENCDEFTVDAEYLLECAIKRGGAYVFSDACGGLETFQIFDKARFVVSRLAEGEHYEFGVFPADMTEFGFLKRSDICCIVLEYEYGISETLYLQEGQNASVSVIGGDLLIEIPEPKE